MTLGQFFTIGGHVAYIADVGETINGQFGARLRVIYAMPPRMDLLCRSTQRALCEDEAGRWITESVERRLVEQQDRNKMMRKPKFCGIIRP